MNIGTQKDTSRRAVELAEQNEGVFAIVGLHPVHTSRSFHDVDELGGGGGAKSFTSRGEIFDAAYYRELALHQKTLAIGECGLDYFHFNEDESRETQVQKQKDAFLAQIMLAGEVKKPLMIHCREAFSDLIQYTDRQSPIAHSSDLLELSTSLLERLMTRKNCSILASHLHSVARSRFLREKENQPGIMMNLSI